jgi:hypothetical protein
MAKRVLMATATVLALGVFDVSAASAATLTVCESGPPTCGYKHIQEAINAATTGDTIRIAAGKYDEHLTVSGPATSLTLRGAGAGMTTIDGTTTIGTVLTIDAGETVKVIGVTITRGTGIHGGGIENAGSLTLKDSAVSRNIAQDGGGIWNDHSLTLNDSTISENAAATKGAAFGGGIDNVGGSVTLNDSTISHNEAEGGLGGGIYNESGTLTLNDSTVSHNEAAFGGGIYNESGTLTLNGSTVSHNTATVGGGIFNEGGQVTGSNDTITGNTPNGIENEGGTVKLDNSKVQSP